MTRIFVLLIAILFIFGCSRPRNSQSEMVAFVQEHAKKEMYFHENPTKEQFESIVKDRNAVLKIIHAYWDESNWKHSLCLDSVFFCMVQEKYGFSCGRKEFNDGILWNASKIEEMKVGYCGDLDVYWAAFFATGETRWLDKVYLNIQNSDQKISGAAKWSMKANYSQQKSVRKYVDENIILKTLLFGVDKL